MNFHRLSLSEFVSWCQDHGEKAFRAEQVWDWVYQKGVTDWGLMTNLSKDFRTLLKKHFQVGSFSLAGKEESKTKDTVCVSSQVGCPARCAFCASGKEGLVRNLSAVEIFEQVYQIQVDLQNRVSHIVFMGMGEPLENYEAVVEALRMLCDENRLHFSERKITVSTVGVVEGIERLTQEGIKVNLVLSLHAPNQHIRKKIIPYARKYELSAVLKAIRNYSATIKRDTTYEYILIAGINDGKEHAEELAELVRKDACTVNLIPYNPVEGLRLQRPQGEQVEIFRRILAEKGVVTTWRYTKGKDIAAACGQLALKKNTETSLKVL